MGGCPNTFLVFQGALQVTSGCVLSTEAPQAPASPPVVSQLSTRSLVLSWGGPNYDGGSAILGYVVEMRAEGLGQAGDWSVVANRCMSTSLRVRSGLEPQVLYRFRVRAYNYSGASEPSEESALVKMETSGWFTTTASRCLVSSW